jgi:hypothetical protein
MYYAGIQNKGSSLRQTVSNLPIGAKMTLNFHGACPPNHATSKLLVKINGVTTGTYACSSSCGTDQLCDTGFYNVDVPFQSNSKGNALIEFYNDSPLGDYSILISDPNIRLPSAGAVVSAKGGRSCDQRCADDGLTALKAHSKVDSEVSDTICNGGSIDSGKNLEFGDESKYTASTSALTSTGGCCKCGAAPAHVPFDASGDTTEFRRHSVTFQNHGTSGMLIIFENQSPDTTGELYLDNPQIKWKEGPGPTSDANIELGLADSKEFVPSSLVVSPVAGAASCGTVALERCGSWNAKSKACSEYHTVATFEQKEEFVLNKMQAVASPRWRISPLTSLPVHWSGYKCSAGTNAGSGVSTAKECQSVCESQSTCGYFSWNTEGESADAGIERCVWSTDAQCATKTSAKYVTYRKPKTSVDALLFPSSASKKYVKIRNFQLPFGSKQHHSMLVGLLFRKTMVQDGMLNLKRANFTLAV